MALVNNGCMACYASQVRSWVLRRLRGPHVRVAEPDHQPQREPDCGTNVEPYYEPYRTYFEPDVWSYFAPKRRPDACI